MPKRIPSMVMVPASATSDLKKHLVVRDVSQGVGGRPAFFFFEQEEGYRFFLVFLRIHLDFCTGII